MSHHREHTDSVIADLVKGAIAGAVGVWALDRVTWAIWNRESQQTLQQEREARPGGMDPAHNLANSAAQAVGKDLQPRQPNPAGIGVHYALGVAPGMLYAVLRKRAPVVTSGHGVLFGLGLFVMQDEILNTLMGTAGAPGEYPWQAHARGVVGHAALGLAMDLTLETLDRLG